MACIPFPVDRGFAAGDVKRLPIGKPQLIASGLREQNTLALNLQAESFPGYNRAMNSPRAYMVIVACTLATVLGAYLLLRAPPAPAIRIGVLHSLSGTMAASERPLADAVRLAVDEINATGGLGRPGGMVVADGR